MSERLSVSGNFLALTIGRLLAGLSMWLALVVLTKLSDPVTVGIYALAQAICVPVAEIARMGLRDVRASDMRAEFRFGDYLGLRLAATALAFGFMLAGAAWEADTWTVLAVIALYGLTRCLELVSDVIYGMFQAQERMDFIGRSLCLQGPLSLGLLTLGYWLSGSLVVGVGGQVLAHALVLAFHDLPTGHRRVGIDAHPDESFWPRWDPAPLRRLFVRALPLAFATVLAMIAVHLPRLAVDGFLGLEALGIFAPILALAMAPSRLVHALGMAATARLARHHAAGERGPFVALLAKMALGAGAVGVAGVLFTARFGEWVLRVVYREEYVPYAGVLVLVVGAATIRFMSDVLQFGMIASRRFWWLTIQYGSVAAAAVAACWLLIPERGLEGAGLAVLLISAIQLAVIAVGLGRNLPDPRPSEAPA